jgi:hypothetical protein
MRDASSSDKRSGLKIVPHSDLRKGVILGEASCNKKRKRDFFRDMEC